MTKTYEIHPFEAAKLGLPPFRCVDIETRRGPMRYVDATTGVETTVGAPGQPMGTCDYCGNGIATCCIIRSSDGKRFTVGIDCVRKVNAKVDPTLDKDVRRAKAKLDKAARQERAMDVADQLANNEELRARLHAQPSPSTYYAQQGETLLNYLERVLRVAGVAGKLRVGRVIAKFA